MRHLYNTKWHSYLFALLSTPVATLPSVAADCTPPCQPALVAFSATALKAGVLLTWETQNETQLSGFKLWHTQTTVANCHQLSNDTPVTPLIPQLLAAQGSATTYSYKNKNLSIKDCYSLEKIGVNGQSWFYIIGPGIEKWLTIPN
ncbi:MAG: hypothetical protein SVR94_10735 [Pseudomonadota bacterium]|nr:hypothetical protein [Pseudomonadota bacterium]